MRRSPFGVVWWSEGLSLVERLLGHMQQSGVAEMVIAANDIRPYTHLGCAVVTDHRRDGRPLTGIEAALAHYAGRHDAVLCVPCDLPELSAREMRVSWRLSPSAAIRSCLLAPRMTANTYVRPRSTTSQRKHLK
jgi:molybdopterin-guanine dinucleotide biosynthesis protein A